MAKLLITTVANSNEHQVSLTFCADKDSKSLNYNFTADPNHPKEWRERDAEEFYRRIEAFLLANGCGVLKLPVIFSEEISVIKKVTEKLKEIDVGGK